MDGAGAIATVTRFHLEHGTTTLLPTTITRPWSEIMATLRAVADVRAREGLVGSCIHGAHLEGPFISPHRLGAQPPFAIDPEPARVCEVLDLNIVRVVTIAPEVAFIEQAIQLFAHAGIRISIGHTTAGYEQVEQTLCAICNAGGVAGGTHLFNAMNGIEGRRPGAVTALMCNSVAHAEVILDMHHIHPASFRLAHTVMRERLLCVTDAMRATGMPEGHSSLGGQAVEVRDGRAVLPNGSLAGSVLTLDRALGNAVSVGMSLPQASALTSLNAARYLGLNDRGLLKRGYLADFVVMDLSLSILEVWKNGLRVH